MCRRPRCNDDVQRRESASAWLATLHEVALTDGSRPFAVVPSPDIDPAADDDNRLRRTSRFIDTFCASGHSFAVCQQVLPPPLRARGNPVFNVHRWGRDKDGYRIPIDCFEATFAHRASLDSSGVQTCDLFQRGPDLVPDFFRENFPHFYVQATGPASHGFFLPCVMFPALPQQQQPATAPFCYDVRHLQFVVQGPQYTIFRYAPPAAPSSIIKRARIDSSTLKYMLREKAMLGYLRHGNIVAFVRSFSPLLQLADTDEKKGKGNYHDTYIEYEDGGDLWELRPPPVEAAPEIARQLLRVLVYLRAKKASALHPVLLSVLPADLTIRRSCTVQLNLATSCGVSWTVHTSSS